MSASHQRILAINPGSTSTKFGLYEKETLSKVWTINHSAEDLESFENKPVIQQETFRTSMILTALNDSKIPLYSIDAFVGRGGMLPPLESGTYLVNQYMIDNLNRAELGEHASNLGAIIAHSLAILVGVDAYIVDPVSVNERSPVARISGVNGIERGPFCHALNSKAVAKRFVKDNHEVYEKLNLIVAHLGGGICVSAHSRGVMIDVTDASQEGPFSPERSGTVPALALIERCFSGKYSQEEVRKQLMGEGGIYSYLGTKDLREVLEKVEAGDDVAKLVFDAMVYQISKEIGAMATVLKGQVNAILLTGGMAHSTRLVKDILHHIHWIGRVEVYPGEEELLALSEGVMRVLQGSEIARELTSV